MLTNQRRVSVDQSERRGSRFNQSEPSSQNAMRGTDGIKGTVPSFLPFPSVTGTNSTSICERTRCGAQRKHVNISRSHGHECHFALVQSGGIKRWRHLSPSVDQSEPSSRHATREVSINNNNNIRYACTCLSPLRRSIPVLFRFAPAFGQPR